MDTVTMVRFAKMEAVRRNETVVLCGSDDGVECASSGPWNSILALGRRSNIPLQVVDMHKSVRLISVAAAGTLGPEPVRFAPDGTVRGGSGEPAGAELAVCVGKAGAAHDTRKITISAGGRVRSFRINTGLPCPSVAADA